jgi:hypothetical protein
LFKKADETEFRFDILATVLRRYAVFMPIMRVHSTKDDMPHFPFLYGDVAGAAMRKALNLRYQLLPYVPFAKHFCI